MSDSLTQRGPGVVSLHPNVHLPGRRYRRGIGRTSGILVRGTAAALALTAVLAAILIVTGAVGGMGAGAGVDRARTKPSTTSTTSPPIAQPPLDRRVVIIGDSVILGARADLFARLGARGWAITAFAARESFFTWDAPAVVDWLRPYMGEVVVIELGPNDGADPAQFAASIDQVMARLQSVPRVYWVNMRLFRPWVPAANAQIAAATTRYPNLRVIDWASRSTPDRSTVGSDGLHLPPYGSAVMADVVAGALDGYVAERTAPLPSPPAPLVELLAQGPGSHTRTAATASVGVSVLLGLAVAVAGAAFLVGAVVVRRNGRSRRSTLSPR